MRTAVGIILWMIMILGALPISGQRTHENGGDETIPRVGAADGSGCLNMLYALEGAIQDVRWHDLPKPVREKLKRQPSQARKGSPL